ncbi:MAG: hypothetical protein Q8O67_00875 [Deltaproteobacteria bacterium]|nr:hypothetical protein [Deltaproteobacteria bacterium]
MIARLLALAVVLLIAGAPARAQAAGVVDANTARALGELSTAAAAKHRVFDVISSVDVRRALELEANKQVAGCATDATSCLAEVAGAMGARYVVFGSISAIGSQLLLSLNLFDSKVASSAGRVVVKAASVDDLLGRIDGAVDELLGAADAEATAAAAASTSPHARERLLVMDLEFAQKKTGEPDVVVAAGDGWSTGSWMLLGGGTTAVVGALAVAGGVIAGTQAQTADAAAKTQRFQDDALRAYAERDSMTNVANGLFIGGGLLVTSGIAVGVAAPLFWE